MKVEVCGWPLLLSVTVDRLNEFEGLLSGIEYNPMAQLGDAE
jgi:hypothetical protein